MLTRKMRLSGGALVATALAASLTACAPEIAITSPPPTMAPEQSVADACAASKAEVEAVIDEARQALETAGASVAAGELPDLHGLAASATITLDRALAAVSNAEVGAAIDEVRAALVGFGEVAAPESLLAVPGYLSELGSRLGDLQSAGAGLRDICTGN